MRKLTYYIFAYWHDSRWDKFVGASVKIWDLAHNLANLGNEVVLFLPKYNFRRTDLPFKIVEIPFINLPLIRFFTFNLFLSFYLLLYYLKQDSNVVYVRRMSSIIPLIYAKFKKAAFFFEVNDDPYTRQLQEGSKTRFLLRSFMSMLLDDINLKMCDKAFIITSSVRKKIAERHPSLALDKFIIMPSGANTDLLKPLDMLMCRSKLKLSKDAKIVGFAGSLLDHQGIDSLIKAAPRIIKRKPETIFLIIGEGPKKKDLINLAQKEGMKNHFNFIGQIAYENISLWLGATDICTAPFLNSAGFRSPVKIFDYMACGKAVVASKLIGTTDIFEKSNAISLVEPGDTTVLAEKILELLTDVNKTEKMAKNGRKFVQKNYDRKLFAKQILRQSQILVV